MSSFVVRKRAQIELDLSPKSMHHYGGYKYPKVNGHQVKKSWISTGMQHHTDYRVNLLTALEQARDNYVKRAKKQLKEIPPQISKGVNKGKLVATDDPPVPDFAMERHVYHKFAGMCFKKEYERYFIANKEHFKYYQHVRDQYTHKTMDIAGSYAFVETKDEWEGKVPRNASSMEGGEAQYDGGQQLDKKGSAEQQLALKKEAHHLQNRPKVSNDGGEWTQSEMSLRVAIFVPGRAKGKKPVFYYTNSLHDAKACMYTIRYHGDQDRRDDIEDEIGICNLINKA